MEIQLSNGICERFRLLENKSTSSAGWLIGWHVETGIVCVGCVTSAGFSAFDLVRDVEDRIEIVPAGLELVGVFMCTEKTVTSVAVEDYLDQLLMAGFKNLEETSEFCVVVQTLDSRTGFLYTNRRRKAEPVKIKNVDQNVIYSDCCLFRVQGSLPLSYEIKSESGENDDDVLLAHFETLKKQILSPVTAFHLQNSRVLLCNQSEFVESVNGLREETPSGELSDFIIVENSDEFVPVKEKKKKGVKIEEKKSLKMKLLFKITGDDAIERTISCLPIIRYEKREFKNVSLTLPIDVVVMVRKNHPLSKLIQTMVQGICSQLNVIKRCLVEYRHGTKLSAVQIFHFKPSFCDHVITVAYPKSLLDSELESKRRQYHQWLLLPQDRPLLRRTNAYTFPEDKTPDIYLTNTHIGLPPSGVTNGNVSLVNGTYTYHHYRQDHIDDNGWGCAYRSLQTIVSWYRHQGYTDNPVPTHKEIQQALVDVGDKPESFVGSTNWIGSLEVSYCLQQLLGITSKILNVSCGTDLANKGRELAMHFCSQGSPIMIGGGVLAHTILGVDFNDKTGQLKFLILDPHYTGAEELNVIQNKGWCGWKGVDFWDKTSYYNLCMPQRPLSL